jgi:hypothetical protein
MDFPWASTCPDRSCFRLPDSRETAVADLFRRLFQRTSQTTSDVFVDVFRGGIHLFSYLFLHGNTPISEVHLFADVRKGPATSEALLSGLGLTRRVLLVRAISLLRDFCMAPKWAAILLWKTMEQLGVNRTSLEHLGRAARR